MAVGMKVANIGPGERRKRMVLGLSALAVGIVLVGALAALGVSPGWSLVAFGPFFMAALGLLQARDHT
jgi:hypothetical protein